MVTQPDVVTQPPIADYALLSDRQTAALVAHGSVDWLCLPRFDSPAVFARLIGEAENGFWRIAPVGCAETGRAYRGGGFVLDTHWSGPSGDVTTTDFLAKSRSETSNDDVTLVRQVQCTRGSVEVDAELVIRFDYGSVLPWVRRCRDADGLDVLHALAGPDSLTLHGPALTSSGHQHTGRFTVEAGQTLTWLLTWRPSHLEPALRVDADAELASVLDDWRHWRRSTTIADGPYAEVVHDSLAVLRALTLQRTGGIVAAPTTSLPEEIGGERNWDYRYCWLRDSAFTIQALATHGHEHVAGHWRDWLLRAIAGSPENQQIMYGVAGERRLVESTLDHLSGYGGSRPVRIGNGAYTQYQADVIGEVMLALDQLRRGGLPDDDFSWDLQVNLLELVEERLRTPDRGIWEVRGDPHLFTHGRVLMWAALDRGIAAVEQFGRPGPLERWRSTRDELADEIRRRGVRDGAFVQHYDTSAVDAALLQIPQTGFVPADSPVMLATVARIESDLLDENGFVRRYVTDGRDGVRGDEGSFLMCTFWLVEQYARSGRRDEAVRLMERLLTIRNDLGLLSEEYDAATGQLLGNYPQAFSHLALIRAAAALS